MQNAKKDYLTMLSVREIRLEAKKSSIHLYSRKNKRELVELILKDRVKVFIEDKSNDEVKAEEERKAFENAKAEEERKAFENAKAEDERKAFENAKVEEERKLIEEEKQRQVLFSKLNILNKKCVASGGIWNKNNKEIKEVYDFTSMLYCEIPRVYRYARSSESDDYEEDEEELNDAMFDEGTPQCDEGTWYEENGYC